MQAAKQLDKLGRQGAVTGRNPAKQQGSAHPSIEMNAASSAGRDGSFRDSTSRSGAAKGQRGVQKGGQDKAATGQSCSLAEAMWDWQVGTHPPWLLSFPRLPSPVRIRHQPSFPPGQPPTRVVLVEHLQRAVGIAEHNLVGLAVAVLVHIHPLSDGSGWIRRRQG